jgi:type VI secretion system lysozyme-like protein
MSRFRPRQGARVPLFDRLVDDTPWERDEARPKRFLDVDELAQSVETDVSRLLNTQCTLPPSFGRPSADGDIYGVLAYGIPDLVSRSGAASADRQVLCADMAAALRLFEPRLGKPEVSFVSYDATRRELIVRVAGMLLLDKVGEPLAFTVAIQANGKG